MGALFVGAALLVVAAFAPFLVLKLIPWAEATLVAYGMSRAPMRTANSAVLTANSASSVARLAGGGSRLGGAFSAGGGGNAFAVGAPIQGSAAGGGASVGAAAGPAGVAAAAGATAATGAVKGATRSVAESSDVIARPALQVRTNRVARLRQNPEASAVDNQAQRHGCAATRRERQ